MAGDAHPTADNNATPAGRGRGPAEDGPGTMSVRGNPTAQELAAVTAAVAAARQVPSAGGGGSPGESAAATVLGDDGDPGRVNAADTGASRAGDAGSNSRKRAARERVAHERRCPVCRERYDSTRPLDGATSVRTTPQGASTVCVDPGSERVYVHSPPPR